MKTLKILFIGSILILPVFLLRSIKVPQVDTNVLYIVQKIKNKEKTKQPTNFKEFTSEYLKELCN